MLVQIVTKPVIGESERERESDGLERRRMRGLAVFFLHTSVCSECSSDHDADGWVFLLFFFVFLEI